MIFLLFLINNLYNFNIIIFYLFFCLITINLKNNLFDFSFINFNVNKNLLNGLLIIHPIILYTSYGMLFYLIYINIFLKFKFLFFNEYFFLKKEQYLKATLILLFSIFLGSW